MDAAVRGAIVQEDTSGELPRLPACIKDPCAPRAHGDSWLATFPTAISARPEPQSLGRVGVQTA